MPQVDFPFSKRLPSDLIELIESAPMPALDAGGECEATARSVQNLLQKHTHFRGDLVEAALWLLAGDLERSHEISQRFDTREGAFWHGIMHRREGDFWNAKYWFRKAGSHPVLVQLTERIGQLRTEIDFGERPGISDSYSKTAIKNRSSDDSLPDRAAIEAAWRNLSLELSDCAKLPSILTDECEKALASQTSQLVPLQRICWLEWQFLFHYGWD